MSSIIIKKKNKCFVFLLPNGKLIFNQPIIKLRDTNFKANHILTRKLYISIYCFYVAERFGLLRRISI